ncbi:MAG TPA: sugar ABC transporter substrate-binding protein [Clostridiaceae bacterium]|nr:sugar ABC transporter substrate-binding protein [Clostridiaceae bacterium]
MKKNSVRKLVSTLLLLVILIGLAACGGGKGKLDIGIVLPTKDEDRWLADEAKFKEIIEEKGYKAEIMYSQASSSTEKANVEALIEKGIKVLLICPFDGPAAASTVEMAKEEGVQVISYDRLIIGTEAIDYYVAFESVKIGEAMGEYLVEQAAAYGGDNLNLYLYSGALTDNNSFSFFRGYWNALQPKIADGTFVVRNSDVAMKYKDTLDLSYEELYEIMQSVDTEWDPAHAKTLAEADLTNATKEEKALSFIIAPDDNTARAVADAFLADADVEEYRICGADGVEGSVQYLIDGKQDMTVYCNPEMLVTSAMELAEKLINGDKVETAEVVNNEAIDVPTIRSDVQTITRDNIVEVFFDGGVYDAKNYTNYENISDAVKP